MAKMEKSAKKQIDSAYFRLLSALIWRKTQTNALTDDIGTPLALPALARRRAGGLVERKGLGCKMSGASYLSRLPLLIERGPEINIESDAAAAISQDS